MPTVTGLYAIIDVPHARGVSVDAVLGAVLAGGCRCVQLRAKQAETVERIALARAMAPACASKGAALWIDDDVDAALALGNAVAGVHLGQEDLASLSDEGRARARAGSLRLGVSTHDLAQLERAFALRPDYVGFGPVFPTTGKANPDPVVGLDTLARACSIASIAEVPVVAIGGIDSERAPACIEAGAAAVAVIGALVADRAPAIERRSRALTEACGHALATRSPGAT